jgi:hypothetical protein
MDMLSGPDLRAALLDEFGQFKDSSNTESWLGTVKCESFFGTVGPTMPLASYIYSVLDHMAVVAELKNDPDKGFSTTYSKRRRHHYDSVSSTCYNDGTEDIFDSNETTKFMRLIRNRAKNQATATSSVRGIFKIKS